MQGSCTRVGPLSQHAPSQSFLRPVLPRQCLLLAGTDLLVVEGQLWLDGMYAPLTTLRDGDGTFRVFIEVDGSSGSGSDPGAELWMMGVRLQGNGKDGTHDCNGPHDCNGCGLHAESRVSVYMEGVYSKVIVTVN